MTDLYLSHAARGRTAWWRYLMVLGLAFAAAMLAGALMLLVAGFMNVLPADLDQKILHPSVPAVFYLVNGVMFGLLVLGLALMAWWLQSKRPTDLLGAWSWAGFGQGLAIWSVVLVASALVDFAIAPSGFKVTANSGVLGLLAVALVGLGVQTFAEEYIFRGYLTQGLILAFRGRMAPTAVVSGLLFGSMHIPNGLPQAVSATVFGMVLAVIAIRTGGIAFGWGLHLINNLFAAVVLVSNGDVLKGSPGLFTQDTPHLMWWDTVAGGLTMVLLAVVMLRRGGKSA